MDPNPDTCTLSQGSGQVVAPTAWTSSVEVTYNIPNGFVAGVYIYTINFTDDYGNSVSDSVTFTVKEETTSGGGGGGDDSSTEINLLPLIIIGLIIAITIPGSLISYRVIKKKHIGAKPRESELAKDEKTDHEVAFLPKAKKTLDLGHDVFICHSSKDKEIADATCHFLEQNGIKCWIAPRDVSTGSYAASIVDAIETSKLLVIIFSNNSNVSDHVKNELEIAVSSGITIQPFRIEDVEPSTEMKYYIKRMHWLDALTPPLEDHLSKLTEMISKLLEVVSN